ncbi:MAG: MFS transporter [Pseudomonadota bacterium]
MATSPDTNPVKLLPEEGRAIGVLSLVVVCRMLGLFMILPVLAVHTTDYPGATPALIGLVIGAYGITQAALQIPFGLLSDRIGRRPVIVGGLCLLAAGSVLAATAQTLPILIAARVLQGAGAISAAATALLADLTRFEVRTRAMALLGASIGASFMLSLILGPLLAAWLGARSIFWLTGALAVGGAVLVLTTVPSPPSVRAERSAFLDRARLAEVFASPALLRLDAGVFLVHLQLTALFVAVPLVLRDELNLAAGRHWQVYVLAIVTSLLATIPMIRALERGVGARRLWVMALIALVVSQAVLAVGFSSLPVLVGALVFFFVGFNFIEARLPAEVTREAPGDLRGAATGVYASSQFFGAFVGGSVGGVLYGVGGAGAVFAFGAVAAALWLMLLGEERASASVDVSS